MVMTRPSQCNDRILDETSEFEANKDGQPDLNKDGERKVVVIAPATRGGATMRTVAH
jgi:hypothetical protein